MGRGRGLADHFSKIFGNRRGAKRPKETPTIEAHRFKAIPYTFAPENKALAIDTLLTVYVEDGVITVVEQGFPHHHYTSQEWDDQWTKELRDAEGFEPLPPAAKIIEAWSVLYGSPGT